jgi:hypothetical protein
MNRIVLDKYGTLHRTTYGIIKWIIASVICVKYKISFFTKGEYVRQVPVRKWRCETGEFNLYFWEPTVPSHALSLLYCNYKNWVGHGTTFAHISEMIFLVQSEK